MNSNDEELADKASNVIPNGDRLSAKKVAFASNMFSKGASTQEKEEEEAEREEVKPNKLQRVLKQRGSMWESMKKGSRTAHAFNKSSAQKTRGFMVYRRRLKIRGTCKSILTIRLSLLTDTRGGI